MEKRTHDSKMQLLDWSRGARRHDHINPVLTTLHWLPVHKRVMFKTVVLAWKRLNDSTQLPICVPVVSASNRSSTSTCLLPAPRARTMIGQWSFAVTGLSLWNSLPAALRRPEMTLHTSKRQLKAYLFHI